MKSLVRRFQNSRLRFTESVAVTLISEAAFDTTDFATAKGARVRVFELRMKRLNAARDAWAGTFQRGDEQLEVMGHLE